MATRRQRQIDKKIMRRKEKIRLANHRRRLKLQREKRVKRLLTKRRK